MTSPATPSRSEPITLPHLLAGRYELRALLGSGGMGDVYRGVDVLLYRAVAVKLLRTGDGSAHVDVARFHAEACALAAVSSPYVVAVHDFGFAEEGLYTVMRHVSGHALDQVLSEQGALSPRRAARVTAQVLSGLIELHERGLVHGDVKPGNVVIDPRRGAVLIDLGVAADLRRGRGLAGGTHPYMAPEVMLGRVDPRADLFAAGMLLVAAATGSSLRDHADCMQLTELIPAPLAAVARVAIDLEPDSRYRDARAMREAVRAAVTAMHGVDVEAILAAPGRRRDPEAPTARPRTSKSRM